MTDTARKVGDHFGLEYWRKQDAAKAFPKEFWLAVCDAGLCGAALPTEVGGAGLVEPQDVGAGGEQGQPVELRLDGG